MTAFLLLASAADARLAISGREPVEAKFSRLPAW